MSVPNPSAGGPMIEDNRLRLLEHFGGEGPHENDRWSALWDAGDFLPWDQGVPNPALVDLLSERKDLVGESLVKEDGKLRRKRAFVPGCGRGYDVLLLSSLGYDAYGLEVSSKAVDEANEWAKLHIDEYPVQDAAIGRGAAKFILGDFFANEWLAEADHITVFELIYDYTFFCALDPSRRPEWALRYSQLLSPLPESVIICVEFPVGKDPLAGGPPFASPSVVYVAHLRHPGVVIPYDEAGQIETPVKEDGGGAVGFERIDHWKPAQSHSMGRGKDWVSVWKRSL